MNQDCQRVLQTRQPDVTSSSVDAAHVLDPRSNIGRLYPVVLYAWDTWRCSRMSTSCPLGALLLILLYDKVGYMKGERSMDICLQLHLND